MFDAPARRFPPPWSVEETDACFIVRDANRQALAYVYCEEEPGRRAAAKLLTRDEARRNCSQHRQAAGAAAVEGRCRQPVDHDRVEQIVDQAAWMIPIIIGLTLVMIGALWLLVQLAKAI